jgi:ABC-type glutathione transport system ATPase component
MAALLEVRNLCTHFNTDDGGFPALDGVGFPVEAGRTLAIVGESGCGKSVTSMSIMGMVPSPPGLPGRAARPGSPQARAAKAGAAAAGVHPGRVGRRGRCVKHAIHRPYSLASRLRP